MRWFAPFLIVLGISIATLANACSYDWKYSDGDQDGGRSGTSGTSGKEGGGSQEGGSGGPPTGESCALDKACPIGICVFAGNQCSGVGKCVDAECTDEEVCTCKGERMSRCLAAKGAYAIDESGASCPQPPKVTFDCYGTPCVQGKQWCRAPKTPDPPKCMDYQTACKPDCSCPELPQAPCSCTTDANGNVIIKC